MSRKRLLTGGERRAIRPVILAMIAAGEDTPLTLELVYHLLIALNYDVVEVSDALTEYEG